MSYDIDMMISDDYERKEIHRRRRKRAKERLLPPAGLRDTRDARIEVLTRRNEELERQVARLQEKLHPIYPTRPSWWKRWWNRLVCFLTCEVRTTDIDPKWRGCNYVVK